MSLRRKFDRKIREKEEEIQTLEEDLRSARAYLSAMRDALKMLPNEGDGGDTENLSEVVRPGSAMDLAVRALREAAKPMHIMELLKAMGKEPTAENRGSIGSSLAAYVRRSAIFTRPAPNTFGLVEWGVLPTEPPQDGPPDDFGLNS